MANQLLEVKIHEARRRLILIFITIIGRLSHLLQIVDAENVVVVVTRWFGGIHLGPDRFKDINNCARGALEECGFIKDNNSKKTKKQNNKK